MDSDDQHAASDIPRIAADAGRYPTPATTSLARVCVTAATSPRHAGALTSSNAIADWGILWARAQSLIDDIISA